MIDLEAALTTFVERAPVPPGVEGVVRRGRQHRRRRRGVAFATTLVVLVAGVGAANAVVSARRPPHVAGAPKIERVRVTMLDGSQLEISGPENLGLTKLDPAFNAELDSTAGPTAGEGHSFTVQRNEPVETGAQLGEHTTQSGNNLVVYETPTGADGVVQIGEWWLITSVGKEPVKWGSFGFALQFVEAPDGYLVFRNDPVSKSQWRLRPTDAPDVQLGGEAHGSGAAFSFFGPSTYPSGCPAASSTRLRTGQGWPVDQINGTWWCDPEAKVRVRVEGSELASEAVQDLRVKFVDSGHAVQRVTALDGTTYEVTAPAEVLTQFAARAVLTIDGMTTQYPLDVAASRSGIVSLPDSQPTYATADGHHSYTVLDDDQISELVVGYGRSGISIDAHGLSQDDIRRIASLIRAHKTNDGFLVLDPVAPMYFSPGTGSGISLAGADIELRSDGTVEVVANDGVPYSDGRLHPPVTNQVHARRVG